MADNDSSKAFTNEALEFDAPKYKDFSRTPYRRRLRAIESFLVSQQEIDISSSEYEADENDGNDIDWFQRSHWSHESSRPPSPPQPLITPQLTSKKVGLGSPGRVILSTSSNGSSLSGRRPFSKAEEQTFTSSPLRAKRPVELAAKSPLIQSDLSEHLDYLSRSPSPPDMSHHGDFITGLEDAFVFTPNHSGHYSRKESYDFGDAEPEDELLTASAAHKRHNLADRVTMRPQRVLIEREDLVSNHVIRKVAKVGARFCPPPPLNPPLIASNHVRKPVKNTARPNYVATNSSRVHESDIKRILLEHNQRVRSHRR